MTTFHTEMKFKTPVASPTQLRNFYQVDLDLYRYEKNRTTNSTLLSKI